MLVSWYFMSTKLTEKKEETKVVLNIVKWSQISIRVQMCQR